MNYRNTKAKLEIISTIENNGHMTVEELIRELEKKQSNISIATVYRNLTILQEEGKLKRIYSSFKVMYETIKESHYHFECTKCHHVSDIERNDVEVNIKNSLNTIDCIDVFIYGLCNKCKN